MLEINTVMKFIILGQTGLLEGIGPLELLLAFVLIAVLALVIVLAVLICVKPVKPKRGYSNLSENTNSELSRSDTKPKEVASGKIGQSSAMENDSSSPEGRSTNYKLSRSDTKPKEVVSGEIGQSSAMENDSPSPEDRNWCMFIHLSQFCVYIIPIAGLIAPLILWLMKKDGSALIDLHGRIVMNWIITEFILVIVFVILCFVIVGIPLLLGLLVVSFVFPILGAVKVQNGETWIYPFSFKFLKLDF